MKVCLSITIIWFIPTTFYLTLYVGVSVIFCMLNVSKYTSTLKRFSASCVFCAAVGACLFFRPEVFAPVLLPPPVEEPEVSSQGSTVVPANPKAAAASSCWFKLQNHTFWDLASVKLLWLWLCEILWNLQDIGWMAMLQWIIAWHNVGQGNLHHIHISDCPNPIDTLLVLYNYHPLL